jgi:hypothetical protein
VFLATIIAMLLWTLLRHRENDSYRSENWAFLIILPLFVVAKQLLLSEAYFAAGSSMAIALFRMAFLVMLERTLTQFMTNVFQVAILRNVWLDRSIKLLALVFVVEGFLPRLLVGGAALLLALLLLFRLAFWKPLLAMRRLDLGIMYLGYLSIVAQLLIEFVNTLMPVAWIGSVSVHVFTFGVMGLILGMGAQTALFERAAALGAWEAILFAPAFGRLCCLVLARAGRGLDRPGLGRTALQGATARALVLGGATAAALALLLPAAHVLSALALAAAALAPLLSLARREGAVNGDFLGSAVVACETCALLPLAFLP